MQYLSTLILALSAISTISAASVGSTLNNTTLLQNGQTAQGLNTLFQTIKSTDACSAGDSACIGSAIAVCTNSTTWDTVRGQCGGSDSCFAIPSIRESGVLLACTSLQNAISVIDASGATGGIFGNSTATGITSNSTGPSSASSIVTVTATAPATVTVTVLPSLFTAQSTVTTTISPEEASSILSSIAATATLPSPSGVASPPSASVTSSVTPVSSASSISSSIILLTTSPVTVTAATAPAQNVAAAQPTASTNGGY